jgi:glycosyltransferase A (GT-A) superfamily protein (DUF2064 family)
METRFGVVPPRHAGDVAGTLAVQLIALVSWPASGQSAPLRGTLDAMLAAPVARRVLVIDGPGADRLPAGFELMAQRGGDLGERLAGALADAHAMAALPMLLVRADARGVTPDVLADAARSLLSGEADAAFGPASDGGFWLLGLPRPDRSLVAGLPGPSAGSGAGTGRTLLERLASAGLRVALAPRLEFGGAPAGQATGPVTVTRVP